MGWSSDFKAALLRPYTEPRYLLVNVGIPANVLRPFGGNGGIRLSSFALPGWRPVLRADGSSTSGGYLSVRDWTCSPLTFEVGVIGEAIADLRRIVQRGSCWVLKVGFGSDPLEFQTVAVGTLMGVGLSGSGWVLRFKGLEGSLQSRFTVTAGETYLGHDLLTTTTNDPLGISSGETDIDLVSVAGLQTAGVVQVTADNGSTYLVSYTGIAGSTLTGCTTPAFGSTFATTSSGAAVSEVMYTSGHPIECAARVLASTGDGTNGAYDTLQASWGLGIPAALLDERDMIAHVGIRQPSSGADDWQWVQPDTIEDVGAALSAWLSGGGYYLTQRQGAVTVRGGVLPWGTSYGAGVAITDRDVVSVDGYEAWSPDHPVEYAKTRITDANGGSSTSATSPLDHVPALDVLVHSPGGIYTDTPNRTAIMAELVSTLKEWDVRTPEAISLTLRGRWWGFLAPGDSVPLDLSPHILTSRTLGAWAGRRVLVVRASVDWFGKDDVTRVELLSLPSDEAVAWRPVS